MPAKIEPCRPNPPGITLAEYVESARQCIPPEEGQKIIWVETRIGFVIENAKGEQQLFRIDTFAKGFNPNKFTQVYYEKEFQRRPKKEEKQP